MKGQTTTAMDLERIDDGQLERRLRAYAGARLSPDAWASLRMRAEVIERGRPIVDRQLRRGTPWNVRFRRALLVGLVSVLAVMAGGTTALAASPGGPLYGVRLQVESALLPATGPARTDAEEAQLGQRIDEISGAVKDGNDSAADAASDAYGQEVDAAVHTAAQTRAELLGLRATIARHLNHLESLVKPNDKASANLKRLIARTQAALADIDRKLAALPVAP